MQRKVSIELVSNIKRYTATLKSCNNYLVIQAHTHKSCLQFFTEDRFIQLILSPKDNKYYTAFYYNLDLCCAHSYNLSANFLKRENETFAINTFYLIDKIYGLKINGLLNFNKI